MVSVASSPPSGRFDEFWGLDGVQEGERPRALCG